MLIVPFQLNHTTYAIDARSIVRVLPFCRPQPQPDWPLGAAGKTHYGDRELPVIDLVQILVGRRHQAILSTRTFLVEVPYRGVWHYLFLLVEGVTGVRKVSGLPQPCLSSQQSEQHAYLGDMIYNDGWQIQLVEVDQILEEPLYDPLFSNRVGIS